MRRRFVFSLSATVVLLCCISSTGAAQESGGKAYTAFNIWYEQPEKIYSTNFQKGTFLDAGTEVENIEQNRKQITFTVSETGERPDPA